VATGGAARLSGTARPPTARGRPRPEQPVRPGRNRPESGRAIRRVPFLDGRYDDSHRGDAQGWATAPAQPSASTNTASGTGDQRLTKYDEVSTIWRCSRRRCGVPVDGDQQLPRAILSGGPCGGHVGDLTDSGPAAAARQITTTTSSDQVRQDSPVLPFRKRQYCQCGAGTVSDSTAPAPYNPCAPVHATAGARTVGNGAPPLSATGAVEPMWHVRARRVRWWSRSC
jgi:hypothetical protein